MACCTGLLRFRRGVFILVVVAPVVAAVQVPQVRFAPDLEAIVPRSDLAHASHATVEDYVGRGDPLVVGVLTENPAEEGVFHPRAHYRLLSSLSGAPIAFADLVDDAYQQTNVVVFLRSAHTQDILRVVQWVEAFVTREFGLRVSRATPTRLHEQLSLGVGRWLAHLDPTVVHWQTTSGSQIGFAGPASLLIRTNEVVVVGHLSRLVTSRSAVFLFTAVRFGAVTAGLLHLVPLSLGLVMSCGLLGLCGISVEVSRSMTAARVIGIGDDSTLHLVPRSRELVRAGVTATTALIGRTRASTGTTICVDAGMVMAGFGVWMGSRFSPTFSLGSRVALPLGACVLVTVTVVPALLTGVRPRFLSGAVRASPTQAPVPSQPLEDRAS